MALEPYAEALAIRTRDVYAGIRATLSLPASGDVGPASNFGEASVHYFNFYVGIDNLIEGGVSYTKKFSSRFDQGEWRQFLNPGHDSSPSSVGFSRQIVLEITTDAKHRVSLKLGAMPVGSHAGIGPGQVKMVIAAADKVASGKSYQVWFSTVTFSKAELLPVGSNTWRTATPADFQAADHRQPQGRPGVMRQGGGGLLSANIPQPT